MTVSKARAWASVRWPFNFSLLTTDTIVVGGRSNNRTVHDIDFPLFVAVVCGHTANFPTIKMGEKGLISVIVDINARQMKVSVVPTLSFLDGVGQPRTNVCPE